MSFYRFLSLAMRYPTPGWMAELKERLEGVPAGPEQEAAAAFVCNTSVLSLGECEELYTRTFELNPLAAPYLGHVLYGDDYKRGNFLVTLRRAYRQVSQADAAGSLAGEFSNDLPVSLLEAGELPDHLSPVFAYLALAEQPAAELTEALELALPRIAGSLRKKEPYNPYGMLLEAACKIKPGEAASTGEQNKQDIPEL